jgi:hypothetical protein
MCSASSFFRIEFSKTVVLPVSGSYFLIRPAGARLNLLIPGYVVQSSPHSGSTYGAAAPVLDPTIERKFVARSSAEYGRQSGRNFAISWRSEIASMRVYKHCNRTWRRDRSSPITGVKWGRHDTIHNQCHAEWPQRRDRFRHVYLDLTYS